VLGKRKGPGVGRTSQAKEVGGDFSVISIVSRFARVQKRLRWKKRRQARVAKHVDDSANTEASAVGQLESKAKYFPY
jgi:hypothetical protein